MERCYVTGLSLAVHFAYVVYIANRSRFITLNCRESLDQREVDILVRPLINWQNARTHKSAKCVIRKLQQYASIQCCLFNTMRKGDADLRFYITTVQDG